MYGAEIPSPVYFRRHFRISVVARLFRGRRISKYIFTDFFFLNTLVIVASDSIGIRAYSLGNGLARVEWRELEKVRRALRC